MEEEPLRKKGEAGLGGRDRHAATASEQEDRRRNLDLSLFLLLDLLLAPETE